MPAAVATGLFRSLASFSAPPTTQGSTGNITGAYTPVTGLQSLACMDAPESFGDGIKATEAKEIERILAEGYRHVLLGAYYSALFYAAELGWRCTVDGVEYDLLSVESDSQRTQSRLRLQRVEV